MWLVLALLASPVCGHVAMPGVEVSLHHMTLTIKDADSGLPKLTASLGLEHQWPDHKHAGFAACKDPPRDSSVCIQNQVARFELDRKEQCYTIRWSALSCTFTPMDCFPLTGASWYGGSEAFTQHWPSNQERFAMAPYVAGDIYAGPHYGSVLDRYWLSSAGIAIHVENHVPLHVSWNDEGDGKFCLKGSYSGRYYQNPDGKLPHLEYTVCEGSDMVQAHHMLHPMKYKLPSQLPDLRMLKSPIWSTWARYKMHVNENDVMELAREINEHGFSNSQLEIDDKYTPTYGEVSFDRNKFPAGSRLVEKLHEMGFRVTTWLTPFVNLESPLFEEGSRAGYFVKDPLGEIPALVKWWQGVGASIDVTNPAAVQWFSDRLRSFQNETGVDSFKFDAGECNWFPPGVQTHVPLENPNDYASEYVGVLATFGGMVETRVGYRSQHHPIFVRMMDKDSVWGYNNGLKTMIPNVLLMSVLGYHYCLPDMIGGNGYAADGSVFLEGSELPSKELFIRWTQLSAYLPAMQFSFVPWQYDAETVDIARAMVRVHEELVYPLLLEAGQEMLRTGAPIIRPLWYYSPRDPVAQGVDSQFLVGARLLVAPVLEHGARARDVYLPRGRWADRLRGGEAIQGPVTLRGYRVELSEVAAFWLVDSDDDKEEL